MHNFTTFAFNTLSTDPVVRQMWKVPVVRLALECDYVMRALLSVSALHLAHNRPERRDFFISRALTYHQMASRTAMGLMGALDGENCEKLYLFSVLTIFFGMFFVTHPLFTPFFFTNLQKSGLTPPQKPSPAHANPQTPSSWANPPSQTGSSSSEAPAPSSKNSTRTPTRAR